MDCNQNGYGLGADYLPDLMTGMKDKVQVEILFLLLDPSKERWFFLMSTANLKRHARPRPQGPKQPPNIIRDTK